MSAPPYILFPGNQTWRVGTLRAGEPEVRDVSREGDVVANAAAVLRELGYAGQGIVLALPSAWCFAASIETSDLPRGDRRAMVYRLEEKLPIPAEEFVADFAHGFDGRALGVAVRIAQVKPLIDALEAARVPVQSVVPAALLAAAGIDMPRSGETSALLIGNADDDSADLVVTCDDHLLSLSNWPKSREDLRLALDICAIEHGRASELFACDVDPSLADAKPLDGSLQIVAIRGAGEILAGRKPAHIELRRDALAARDRLRRHRRALDAMLAAAAVLLLAVAGASLLRAHRYEQSIRASQDQLAADFAKAFPDWETPSSIKAVLSSERRKLASSLRVDPGKASANLSALRTMQIVLGSLPTEPRISLDRMVFAEDAFTLEGRMTSLDGLSQLKSAAAKDGWDTSQSQAHRDGDGFWSFTMHGTNGAGAVAAGEQSREQSP